MADRFQSPSCFYHTQQKIVAICLQSMQLNNSEDCIAPLCEECVDIHRREFASGEHLSKTIPFEYAKMIAISAITSEQERQAKVRQPKQLSNSENSRPRSTSSK
jgi:hypothetical protein